MWFNNRFTRDNKINFVPSEWKCTDVDEFQFCRVISEHEFEYIQLRNEELKKKAEKGRNALESLNGITKLTDWYQDEIDVREYEQSDIDDYVSPYGGILDGSEGQDRNQLIAECIFETNMICGFYDD